MQDLPAPAPRTWLLPHRHGTRGEPAVRPLLADTLGLTADALPLQRDERGRPRLHAPLQRYDLSWSHSGDALLLALGEAVTLGVDIERLRARPRALDLAQRYFHPEEVAWMRAQRDDALELAFVRLWCAKEAILKAHGGGIALGLEKPVFAEMPSATGGTELRLIGTHPVLGPVQDWALREWEPLPGYHAAMAWRAT
ncbi:MAG: 4'-phosphopantetheinyl transferase superfamily protein [Pseudoxanthomonas sp.]